MFKALMYFSLAVISLQCGGQKSVNARIKLNASSTYPSQKDSLSFTLKAKGQTTIDSVHFNSNNKRVQSPLALSDFNLGKHQIKAIAYVGGKSFNFSKDFWVYASKEPKLFKYRIRNQYPHDPKAYTQGLEFDGEDLYESTGLNGRSSLRRVNYKTGEILQEQKLDQVYFGEGLTVVDKKVIQLTWKAQMGFVYDKESLQMLDTFAYTDSQQGWGLCHNDQKLFKSDGTHQIWFLDKNTLTERGKIQVMTHNKPINKINELEYAKGLIYANTYQFGKDVAVVIHPETGVIEGVIDFTGLREKLKNNPKAEVLNGIAYHPKRNTFFVTGKLWNTLFEVEFYEP